MLSVAREGMCGACGECRKCEGKWKEMKEVE